MSTNETVRKLSSEMVDAVMPTATKEKKQTAASSIYNAMMSMSTSSQPPTTTTDALRTDYSSDEEDSMLVESTSSSLPTTNYKPSYATRFKRFVGLAPQSGYHTIETRTDSEIRMDRLKAVGRGFKKVGGYALTGLKVAGIAVAVIVAAVIAIPVGIIGGIGYGIYRGGKAIGNGAKGFYDKLTYVSPEQQVKNEFTKQLKESAKAVDMKAVMQEAQKGLKGEKAQQATKEAAKEVASRIHDEAEIIAQQAGLKAEELGLKSNEEQTLVACGLEQLGTSIEEIENQLVAQLMEQGNGNTTGKGVHHTDIYYVVSEMATRRLTAKMDANAMDVLSSSSESFVKENLDAMKTSIQSSVSSSKLSKVDHKKHLEAMFENFAKNEDAAPRRAVEAKQKQLEDVFKFAKEHADLRHDCYAVNQFVEDSDQLRALQFSQYNSQEKLGAAKRAEIDVTANLKQAETLLRQITELGGYAFGQEQAIALHHENLDKYGKLLLQAEALRKAAQTADEITDKVADINKQATDISKGEKLKLSAEARIFTEVYLPIGKQLSTLVDQLSNTDLVIPDEVLAVAKRYNEIVFNNESGEQVQAEFRKLVEKAISIDFKTQITEVLSQTEENIKTYSTEISRNDQRAFMSTRQIKELRKEAKQNFEKLEKLMTPYVLKEELESLKQEFSDAKFNPFSEEALQLAQKCVRIIDERREDVVDLVIDTNDELAKVARSIKFYEKELDGGRKYLAELKEEGALDPRFEFILPTNNDVREALDILDEAPTAIRLQKLEDVTDKDAQPKTTESSKPLTDVNQVDFNFSDSDTEDYDLFD